MHPKWRNGKELVRRATVAVLKDCGDGTNKIEYILRDISKIASVQYFMVFHLVFTYTVFVFATALLTFFVCLKLETIGHDL